MLEFCFACNVCFLLFLLHGFSIINISLCESIVILYLLLIEYNNMHIQSNKNVMSQQSLPSSVGAKLNNSVEQQQERQSNTQHRYKHTSNSSNKKMPMGSNAHAQQFWKKLRIIKKTNGCQYCVGNRHHLHICGTGLSKYSKDRAWLAVKLATHIETKKKESESQDRLKYENPSTNNGDFDNQVSQHAGKPHSGYQVKQQKEQKQEEAQTKLENRHNWIYYCYNDSAKQLVGLIDYYKYYINMPIYSQGWQQLQSSSADKYFKYLNRSHILLNNYKPRNDEIFRTLVAYRKQVKIMQYKNLRALFFNQGDNAGSMRDNAGHRQSQSSIHTQSAQQVSDSLQYNDYKRQHFQYQQQQQQSYQQQQQQQQQDDGQQQLGQSMGIDDIEQQGQSMDTIRQLVGKIVKTDYNNRQEQDNSTMQLPYVSINIRQNIHRQPHKHHPHPVDPDLASIHNQRKTSKNRIKPNVRQQCITTNKVDSKKNRQQMRVKIGSSQLSNNVDQWQLQQELHNEHEDSNHNTTPNKDNKIGKQNKSSNGRALKGNTLKDTHKSTINSIKRKKSSKQTHINNNNNCPINRNNISNSNKYSDSETSYALLKQKKVDNNVRDVSRRKQVGNNRSSYKSNAKQVYKPTLRQRKKKGCHNSCENIKSNYSNNKYKQEGTKVKSTIDFDIQSYWHNFTQQNQQSTHKQYMSRQENPKQKRKHMRIQINCSGGQPANPNITFNYTQNEFKSYVHKLKDQIQKDKLKLDNTTLHKYHDKHQKSQNNYDIVHQSKDDIFDQNQTIRIVNGQKQYEYKTKKKSKKNIVASHSSTKNISTKSNAYSFVPISHQNTQNPNQNYKILHHVVNNHNIQHRPSNKNQDNYGANNKNSFKKLRVAQNIYQKCHYIQMTDKNRKDKLVKHKYKHHKQEGEINSHNSKTILSKNKDKSKQTSVSKQTHVNLKNSNKIKYKYSMKSKVFENMVEQQLAKHKQTSKSPIFNGNSCWRKQGKQRNHSAKSPNLNKKFTQSVCQDGM